MKKKQQVFFKEACSLLFDNLPDLKSFGWRQYTPYFNDGDPCVFRAYCKYDIYINEWNASNEDGEAPSYRSTYEIERDIENWEPTLLDSLATSPENDEQLVKLKEELAVSQAHEKEYDDLTVLVTSVLGTFDDDDYLNMFGDHCQVTVYRGSLADPPTNEPTVEVTDFSRHD